MKSKDEWLENMFRELNDFNTKQNNIAGHDVILDNQEMNDYNTRPSTLFSDDEHHRYKFANHYGASVRRNSMTYGGKQGLYELAVLFDDSITYDTDITSDVIGWLTWDDVQVILKKIRKL
jgi:hypothetical protein